MSLTREGFLDRVRQAVGQQGVTQPTAPGRDEAVVRSAKACDDLVARFVAAHNLSGGYSHVLKPGQELGPTVQGIMAEHGVKTALAEATHDAEMLAQAARRAGVDVRRWGSDIDPIEASFSAGAGLTGCTWALAETGSLVLTSSPQAGRMISLAPLVHVALVHRNRIVADLVDLFGSSGLGTSPMPAGAILITGPSKTADIELKLVTGVHGPGFVHAIIMP